MKILLLTIFPLYKYPLELMFCKTQYYIFCYMIHKYISRIPGIELIVQHCTTSGRSERFKKYVNSEKFPEADHCILVDNRGFMVRVHEFYEKLRPNIRGAITTISANNAHVGQEDVLFYMVPNGKAKKPHCRLIYWACDHNLCFPDKDPDTIRILVDHKYYGNHKNMTSIDLTDNILEQALTFAENYQGEKKVIVRFISNDGIVTVTRDNINNLSDYKQGGGADFNSMCIEFSKTDVFFVTHIECMGLCVLEASMAGALVVSPTSYIKRCLLNKVHHLEFTGEVPWDIVLANIDVDKSRKLAVRYSWENATKIMYDTFANFDMYKAQNFVFKNDHSAKGKISA